MPTPTGLDALADRELDLCTVCSEEPCSPGCSPECDAVVHETLASTERDGFGPLCADCARDIATLAASERDYASRIDMACGYDAL